MERQTTTDGMSRRRFAGAGLVALAALAMPGRAETDREPATLAEAGRLAGIEVGSAIRSHPGRELAQTIARECTLVTPENALKPPRVARAPGQFHWDEAADTFAFAKRHGLAVHGHTLYWHKQPLEWLSRASEGLGLGKTVAMFGDVFETVMRRFPETRSWDVFNEIAGSGRRLRPDSAIDRFGLDFVERLLHRAREAAPAALLAINENDLECGDCGSKRKNVLSILAELARRGAPLDALGVQGHLSSRHRPDPGETRAFLTRVEELGFQVFLSEMDVNDALLPRDWRQRDAEVAQIYADFLGPVLEVRAVRRVVFWGIADSANWIADGAAERRADGKRQRPALLDRDLGRKPAYYAVREALRYAPRR
jgi:endo-1,4-beta-xylanase